MAGLGPGHPRLSWQRRRSQNVDARSIRTARTASVTPRATHEIRAAKQAAGVVRIPVALDERLTRLAAKTGRSKTYFARRALETFLEDTEDYLLAVASYESSKKTISLEHLRKKFKLRD
jgi:RHH-type rel operon transcriptional repressor/antitoxin RelB